MSERKAKCKAKAGKIKDKVYPTTYAFSGGPLSNWTKSPFRLNVIELVTNKSSKDQKINDKNRVLWQCAEQAIMAAKAIRFKDQKMYERICVEPSAFRVKQLGRKVANFDSDEWDKTLDTIMPDLLLAKYTQHQPSRKALLDTENRTIVEASKRDKKWGIGMAPDDERVLDESKWQGKNLLGKWLTKVRDRIRGETTSPKETNKASQSDGMDSSSDQKESKKMDEDTDYDDSDKPYHRQRRAGPYPCKNIECLGWTDGIEMPKNVKSSAHKKGYLVCRWCYTDLSEDYQRSVKKRARSDDGQEAPKKRQKQNGDSDQDKDKSDESKKSQSKVKSRPVEGKVAAEGQQAWFTHVDIQIPEAEERQLWSTHAASRQEANDKFVLRAVRHCQVTDDDDREFETADQVRAFKFGDHGPQEACHTMIQSIKAMTADELFELGKER